VCVSVCARMCNREQEYLWFIGTIGFLDSSVLQPHRSYDLRDIGSEDPHNPLDMCYEIRYLAECERKQAKRGGDVWAGEAGRAWRARALSRW